MKTFYFLKDDLILRAVKLTESFYGVKSSGLRITTISIDANFIKELSLSDANGYLRQLRKSTQSQCLKAGEQFCEEPLKNSMLFFSRFSPESSPIFDNAHFKRVKTFET